jgi:hypothetical protein
MDWDIVFRAVGALIGLGGFIYQWILRDPRWRSTLKADIELYNILDKDDPNREIIHHNISKVVRSRYLDVKKLGAEEELGAARPRFRVYNVSNLVLGIIFLGGFGYWTFALLADGWNWWALITGFFAFGGLGNLMIAFDKRYE